MKLSQVLKLSVVALALGAMPLHTAFANEVEGSEGRSEVGESVAETRNDSETVG